jgi:hypothetical protein
MLTAKLGLVKGAVFGRMAGYAAAKRAAEKREYGKKAETTNGHS